MNPGWGPGRWDAGTLCGEAKIRDVRCIDQYPNVNPKSKGVSEWFTVALLGTRAMGSEHWTFWPNQRLKSDALKRAA
jgi:hypothetical protein